MNKIKEIKNAINTEITVTKEEKRAIYASLVLYTVGNYIIYDFAYSWSNFWQFLSGFLMCLISTIILIVIADEHSDEFEDEEL